MDQNNAHVIANNLAGFNVNKNKFDKYSFDTEFGRDPQYVVCIRCTITEGKIVNTEENLWLAAKAEDKNPIRTLLVAIKKIISSNKDAFVGYTYETRLDKANKEMMEEKYVEFSKAAWESDMKLLAVDP